MVLVRLAEGHELEGLVLRHIVVHQVYEAALAAILLAHDAVHLAQQPIVHATAGHVLSPLAEHLVAVSHGVNALWAEHDESIVGPQNPPREVYGYELRLQ